MRTEILSIAVFLFLIFVLFLTPTYGRASGFGTHAIAGGTLGYSFAQTDMQALILGLTSHIFLDIMPHHDPKLSDTFDLGFHAFFNLGALVIVERMYTEKDSDSRLLWGAIGGILPDLEHLLFLGKCGPDLCPQKIFPVHNGRLPHHGSAPFWKGYLYESSVITISLLLTF